MISPLSARFQSLIEPGILLSWAIHYFLVTVYETIIIERAPLKLLQINQLRTKAFSRFWLAFSPPPDSAERPPDDPGSSFVNLPSYLSTASGTVLDIGPGSGTFVPYLNASSISTIYGAEPALDMHPALKQTANVAGLGDKYQILSCGGESDSLLPALKKAGLLKEDKNGVKPEAIFDTVICIRVLCSVPNLKSSLSTLYSLLRPGGRLIICEHVINHWRSPKGSILGHGFQLLYTLLGWSFFIGDCHMDRDTATLLGQIGDVNGGWESVELDKQMEWSVLPFTTGVFIKNRTYKK